MLGWLGAVLLWSTLMVLLVRRARRQTGLARATDVAGALVCTAILAFGVVRGIPDKAPESVWETAQGRHIEDSFVTTCRAGAYGRGVSCACLFNELTTRPPGSSPSGFTMLVQSLDYATARGDPSTLRPQAAAAMEACRRDA